MEFFQVNTWAKVKLGSPKQRVQVIEYVQDSSRALIAQLHVTKRER